MFGFFDFMERVAVVFIIVAVVIAIGSFLYVNDGRDIFDFDDDYDNDIEISGDYKIYIEDFAFSRPVLRIKVGEDVVWENKDRRIKHTITSDSGGELGSELLGRDDTYRHIFNEVG